MFIVTKEWIHSNSTSKNGFRAVQIHALGFSWPPPKGWLKHIIGKPITLDQKNAFEIGAHDKEKARKKVREIKDYNLCIKYGWNPSAKEIKKPKKQKLKKTRQTATHVGVITDSFLSTYEWRRLRMQALKKYGSRCMCCGATPESGAVMNVDHIKPRKLWPSLALDINNLQILCQECNHGKGNWDMTDWRPKNVVSES